MPPRTTPTQRQKRLGAEIKKLRMAAGMTAERVAELIGVDRGKISNIEAGVRNISPERLRALAAHCGCTDEPYVDALVELGKVPERNWWDEYRKKLSSGLMDIAELEWNSPRIQTIQTVHIPGLLQTEDYARSIFDAVLPPLPRLEVELHVAHRMDRRRVLTREQPITYTGYVHEAALRMRFGGREATKKQLSALIDASEQANITVRIVPIESGSFPGAGQNLLHAEAAVPQLDTVQLDSAHGPEFMHTPEQLSKYRAHLDWMDEACLSSPASRDVIHGIIREL
ncbi:helix-turn-helix domain-containing protein [Streptomyces sp. NPDC096310]|uniref:helix-turn-helix domain-containing protein n=1 Tax=Streptomyces sp. NPDC096310 TaxID=3366082 RepID=UPI003819DA23